MRRYGRQNQRGKRECKQQPQPRRHAEIAESRQQHECCAHARKDQRGVEGPELQQRIEIEGHGAPQPGRASKPISASVLMRARVWISSWLMTGVLALKRDTMARTKGRTSAPTRIAGEWPEAARLCSVERIEPTKRCTWAGAIASC